MRHCSVTSTVTIWSAPSATAGASGVLTSRPPSHRSRVPIGTGLNSSGMLALATSMSTLIAGTTTYSDAGTAGTGPVT